MKLINLLETSFFFFDILELKRSKSVSQVLLFTNILGNCKNATCARNGLLIAGKYLSSRNEKYRLDFQNSGLHLSCGSKTIKTYGFTNNEALYLDAEGLSLVLLNSRYALNYVLYESVIVWKASNRGRANKLVLQDNSNLVLINECIETLWESETAGECPEGLE